MVKQSYSYITSQKRICLHSPSLSQKIYQCDTTIKALPVVPGAFSSLPAGRSSFAVCSSACSRCVAGAAEKMRSWPTGFRIDGCSVQAPVNIKVDFKQMIKHLSILKTTATAPVTMKVYFKQMLFKLLLIKKFCFLKQLLVELILIEKHKCPRSCL